MTLQAVPLQREPVSTPPATTGQAKRPTTRAGARRRSTLQRAGAIQSLRTRTRNDGEVADEIRT